MTQQAMPADRTRGDIPRAMAVCASVVGATASAAFLLAPDLDLVVARQFALGDGSFSGTHNTPIQILRETFKIIFIVCCGAAAVGLGLTALRRLHRPAVSYLYLILCLSVGPGLVTNLLLKDQWGRARPLQVIEFGGTKAFTPPLIRTDQCSRNCSFVSGEAASMFAAFYAMALIAPQWCITLLLTGTLAGFGAGLIRMAQGAHFLSDVVFAGVFLALTVAGLHWLVFGYAGRSTPRSLPRAPEKALTSRGP